jgi:hypothetical protein
MSKRNLLLLLCSILSFTALAQAQVSENQKLESLAKVWGFLKYYHPQVAKGKLNWDEELARKIAEVKAARDRQELSKAYTQWLDELGKVRRCHGYLQKDHPCLVFTYITNRGTSSLAGEKRLPRQT